MSRIQEAKHNYLYYKYITDTHCGWTVFFWKLLFLQSVNSFAGLRALSKKGTTATVVFSSA